MFNGEDIFNFLGNKNITEDLLIFSLSKSIQNLLKNNNFDSILIKDFNLLKKNLFKPLSKYGNKIYIYNGIFKESKYCGKDIYESIIESLPYFEYIFSNNLVESYDSISNIYKECFIGLRLTKIDGHPNTIDEFESMKIPIINNFSEYGLKWNNKDDIINHIMNTYKKIKKNDKLTNKEFNLKKEIKNLEKIKNELKKDNLQKNELIKLNIKKITYLEKKIKNLEDNIEDNLIKYFEKKYLKIDKRINNLSLSKNSIFG